MKVKVKSKKELEFLEKIFTEVHGTTAENNMESLIGKNYINSAIYDAADKEINVEAHKYTKEAGDYNGFAYLYKVDNVGYLISPSYVEKIVEY